MAEILQYQMLIEAWKCLAKERNAELTIVNPHYAQLLKATQK